MRVIITGGTGLVGRALAADLAGDGHEAIVLSRDPSRASGLPQGVRAERWDGRSADGWAALADGADAIVNLAGENISSGLWTKARRERIRASRNYAGRAVVQAVAGAANKPRVVIQASGINYYGAHGDEIITEDSPAGNGFLPSVCLDWEASTAEVEAQGVRRAIVRSAIILNRRGGALPIWALPFRFFVGGQLGSGRQWVSWIYLLDEVAAIRFLIENEAARGPFNLAAPGPATNAQFSQAMARALRRPNLMRVPGFAMRAVFGELSMLFLHSKRVMPARLLELGFQFYYPKLDEALRDALG